ncbi:MAG: hypothetical protein HY027_17395 [Deltaproteobacteria bacterium]|nr:hypothetical protein [Deltaproteobacteria bacterium]
MQISIANHSSYPTDGGPSIAAVAAEQAAAGLDLVTDGQINWRDPISHFMATLGGVRLGGRRTFFNSTRTFQQPIVNAPVTRGRSDLLANFHQARGAVTVPVKPIVTGPYTLARLSRIEPSAYAHYQNFAVDLSAILAHEVAALAAAWATVIQIEEPAICYDGLHDIRLLRNLFEPLYAARGNAEIAIATYGGDADPIYPQLNSIPADIVAVDLTGSTALWDTIASTGSGKTLALGVVDGRDSTLEDPVALASRLDRLLRRYAPDAIYLQPSCGLRSLTPTQARAKLMLLAAVRRHLQAV